MGATERGGIMSENGLNSLYYAMDPAYIPHVDITKDAVQEGLHLFGDGLLRSEGAWMFYLFIKLGLKLDVVNRAIQAYPNWPRDCRIPPLHAALKDGVTGGKPKPEKTLRMSGAECIHFAQHRCAPRTHPARPAPVTPLPPGGRSVALLTPLLTAEMRAHPAWGCWVKLVEVHSVFILHELTVSDIERLDDLQLEHAERFANVPEYAGMTRPKLHFLSHIAQDVWRYAPPPRFVVLRVRGI